MNKEKNKKPLKKGIIVLIIILAVTVILITAELIRSNSVIEVGRFVYGSPSIPEGFDGARIVSVTDYHNHGGSYEDTLIETIRAQSPDYIFLVGDIVDSWRTDLDTVRDFMEKCAAVAPCYLCYGNHELRLIGRDDQFERYNEIAAETGITVLDNTAVRLERNGGTICLAGTTDTEGIYDLSEKLKEYDKSAPLLWIHHYPEEFETISKRAESCGFGSALVFCGHAHGGLIRIPFTDIGLVAPGQGLFPKYTDGEYFSGNSEMLLSRGCGNSGPTLRMFDPFEIIVCELKKE